VNRTTATALLLLLLLPLACGCGDQDPDSTQADPGQLPVVQCVNYPLAWIAERLAGSAAEVRFEAPADGDPAFWKPTEAQIGAFQKATLILRNGAGYAKWMRVASLPASRVVDTSASFRGSLIDTTGGVSHTHGPGGAHDHGDIAFTTWLDFKQAAAQAKAVSAALRARGITADALASLRIVPLHKELLALDAAMQALGARWGKQPLLGSHPVYQYLARRYGLRMQSVHFEPDAVPTDEQFAQLASLLATHKATWMLWESSPLPATVARLESMGVRCVVFDPCGNRPPTGDFLSVMRANIERLEKALPK
jgi:zinc transport system substrate-binding protein